MRDLPTTMSKFLALGMTLDEVIAATTVNAARSHRSARGHRHARRRRSPADIAILEDVVGPVELEDTDGERVTARRQLRPWATIRAGRESRRAATARSQRDPARAGRQARQERPDPDVRTASAWRPTCTSRTTAATTSRRRRRCPWSSTTSRTARTSSNPASAPHYLYLARHGYILARIDIRGTGASEEITTDEYTIEEQTDGAAAIEWIAAQPWCDGHVNMMGISYGGFTALQVASHRPPHLTSIIPVDFTDDRYTDDCHYRGGLLRMYYDIGWYGTRMIAWGALPPDPEWSLDDWAAVWERHIADNEPYLLKWLRNQTDGPYWRNGSVGDGATIACPTFLIGGWRDGYPNPPLRLYRSLAARGLPVKVLVGPWNHAWPDAAIPGPRIDYPARGRPLARPLVQGRRERRHGRAAGRRLHAGVGAAGRGPARSPRANGAPKRRGRRRAPRAG